MPRRGKNFISNDIRNNKGPPCTSEIKTPFIVCHNNSINLNNINNNTAPNVLEVLIQPIWSLPPPPYQGARRHNIPGSSNAWNPGYLSQPRLLNILPRPRHHVPPGFGRNEYLHHIPRPRKPNLNSSDVPSLLPYAGGTGVNSPICQPFPIYPPPMFPPPPLHDVHRATAIQQQSQHCTINNMGTNLTSQVGVNEISAQIQTQSETIQFVSKVNVYNISNSPPVVSSDQEGPSTSNILRMRQSVQMSETPSSSTDESSSTETRHLPILGQQYKPFSTGSSPRLTNTNSSFSNINISNNTNASNNANSYCTTSRMAPSHFTLGGTGGNSNCQYMGYNASQNHRYNSSMINGGINNSIDVNSRQPNPTFRVDQYRNGVLPPAFIPGQSSHPSHTSAHSTYTPTPSLLRLSQSTYGQSAASIYTSAHPNYVTTQSTYAQTPSSFKPTQSSYAQTNTTYPPTANMSLDCLTNEPNEANIKHYMNIGNKPHSENLNFIKNETNADNGKNYNITNQNGGGEVSIQAKFGKNNKICEACKVGINNDKGDTPLLEDDDLLPFVDAVAAEIGVKLYDRAGGDAGIANSEDEIVNVSQSVYSEMSHISMRASEIAEKIACNHCNRPCFKKIDSLCARLKQDLVRQDGVVSNINSQGIAWSVKDFIFAFTRIVNAWIIIKGYVYTESESLSKIKACLSPDFMKSFIPWQETTKNFVQDLVVSFVNLDNLMQAQKSIFLRGELDDDIQVLKTNIETLMSDGYMNAINNPKEKLENPVLNNYLYTMVEDSEDTQLQATTSGNYFKTGTYNPIMKERILKSRQALESDPKSYPVLKNDSNNAIATINQSNYGIVNNTSISSYPAIQGSQLPYQPNKLLGISVSTQTDNLSQSYLISLLDEKTLEKLFNINIAEKAKKAEKLENKKISEKAENSEMNDKENIDINNKANDTNTSSDILSNAQNLQPTNWLPYKVNVLDPTLNEYSRFFSPHGRMINMSEKIDLAIDRILDMNNLEYFFKQQFTLSYFPEFILKYGKQYKDIRTIVLRCQTGHYIHIREVVHDMKRIMYLVEQYLLTRSDENLEKAVKAYSKEFNEVLLKEPFNEFFLDDITGETHELLYHCYLPK